MGGSERAAERRAIGVPPLILTRHTTVLMLVIAAALWGLAFLLWGQVELDKWLLMSHEALRASEPAVALAQLATGYGMSMVVLVYLLYLWFACRREQLRDAYPVYLLVLLEFGIAAVGGDVLKEILNRPRPFVEYAGQIRAFSIAATPAFPSGHATKSVALALPFLLLSAPRDRWHKGVKVLLAIIVFAVCYSRVLLGAHYVSDVLAGAGMALTCFPLAMLVGNALLRRMTRERLDLAIKIWAVILLGLMIGLPML